VPTNRLVNPSRLWTRDEVLAIPSPVPAVSGVYAWHFLEAPHPKLRPGLLYVGISPAKAASTQTLRDRVRYHFRGNAEGSTLRQTLGCLLGVPLRLAGSGKRSPLGCLGKPTSVSGCPSTRVSAGSNRINPGFLRHS
jgi:hypothetical protein